MQIVSASETEQWFDELLKKAQHEPVHFRRGDEDVAILVSPSEYEKIRQWHVEELLRITTRSSAYAESQGMTEELLEELLADE
jgi:PHD/YefM family antitoxin component YafN of YafNO toxin-antitoxin module